MPRDSAIEKPLWTPAGEKGDQANIVEIAGGDIFALRQLLQMVPSRRKTLPSRSPCLIAFSRWSSGSSLQGQEALLWADTGKANGFCNCLLARIVGMWFTEREIKLVG